jgi:histidinol-phosphate aminotransferase
MIPLRRNIAEMAGYIPGFQPKDGQPWIKLNTNEKRRSPGRSKGPTRSRATTPA